MTDEHIKKYNLKKLHPAKHKGKTENDMQIIKEMLESNVVLYIDHAEHVFDNTGRYIADIFDNER